MQAQRRSSRGRCPAHAQTYPAAASHTYVQTVLGVGSEVVFGDQFLAAFRLEEATDGVGGAAKSGAPGWAAR